MKLSIIIPAYNASNTIRACLDSIYNVGISEQDFEVIVVDDCSTDNTMVVLNDYVQSKTNLHVFRQERNMRQGAARNRGLKEAKGEYVFFVDADDIVLQGLRNAITQAERTQADVVYSAYIKEVTHTEAEMATIDMSSDHILSGSEFCEQYQQFGVFLYPWTLLYRREWLQALNYPFVEYRQHEDRDWLAFVLSQAQSVAYNHQPMYRYKCNPDSTCRNPKYSTIFDHVASGIRHIDLSGQLKKQCPNLSATLYAFGCEEIHHSIRLRNLTKYPWTENKHLYDEQHLKPLLSDMKRICHEYKMPIEVRVVTYCPTATYGIVFLASPLT